MENKREKCYFNGNINELYIVLQQFENDIKFFEKKLKCSDNEEYKKIYNNNLINLKNKYNRMKNKLKEINIEIDYSK